jgi:hypothetical protein
MRQRRTWVIVLFWVAVFVAVGAVGELSADGDEPNEDGVAFGYLAVIGGAVLTGCYLVLTRSNKAPLAPLRTCPSCGAKMECDTRVCTTCGAESQPWIRHHGTWWFRSPSGWQWVDEAGIWRWYRDGTPSGGGTTDMTPNLAIDPAQVEPLSVVDAHSPSASGV